MISASRFKERLAEYYSAAKVETWNYLKAWRAQVQFARSLRFILTTESHVYAFSIAANALLAFVPFILILLGICGHWLHWQGAYNVILQLVRANLPVGAELVIKGITALTISQRQTEVITVILMFYTSSGVFLPLELALNHVWGFAHNRHLARNFLLSFILAVISGVLGLLSVAVAKALVGAVVFLLGWLPWHGVVAVVSRIVLEILSIPFIIAIYFLIYFLLPNGEAPARRVFPAAVMAGIGTEVVKLIYFLTLPLFHFQESYGPFAVPATLLLWAYVGSLVMLWGGHLSAQGPSPRRTASEVKLNAHALQNGS